MNKLEKFLCYKFNKKYCCFTGSGTTAIYLMLKALNLQNKKIVYPAITCMTPVNAAIYAGYTPVFCDVNLSNYTMDINSLKSIIDYENVGIIVPTHIYGHRCNMEFINKIAKEKGIFVLEDAAQSYYFDEQADASIISFGHTKILQCEGGGGAVFTDDKELYNNISNYKQCLPKKTETVDILFDLYRENYYKILNKYTCDDMNKYMLKLQIDNEKTFIYDLLDSDNIYKIINKSDKLINDRISRRKLYDMYLNKKNISLPSLGNNEGLWRYTFMYNGDRKRLLEKVRENNIDISNWYINLRDIYECNGRKLSNAEYIEKHVVNLWIDPRYSEDKIKKDISKINEML